MQEKIVESLRAAAETGFIYASTIPGMLATIGILDYKQYASTIGQFCEKFTKGDFEFKDKVKIDGKVHSGVLFLKKGLKDIERKEEFLSFEDSIFDGFRDDEGVCFGIINVCTGKNGFINQEYVDKRVFPDYILDGSQSTIFETPNVNFQPSTTRHSFTYAAEGLRTGKTVNGEKTVFVWDGDQLVLELSESGKVQSRYICGNDLVYTDEGESTEKHFYVMDLHGSVVQLTDENGTVTKNYEYDSFGNEVKPDSKDDNPFRYCAEYYDKETEEIYLRARYYQPTVGRFLTRDTYTGEEDVTRPRQHRHLKRKDSIRFLVFLDFSLFSIRSGRQNRFFSPRCACVALYS